MAFGSVFVSSAIYIASISFPLILILFCYRTYLDPLSKFPGPPIARLSDGYAGFYALSRRLHLATYLDLQRYGPVVRLGPHKLVFNSVEALRDIYDNERVTKSHVYSLTLNAKKPSLFNAIDKHQHRNKRRLIARAINDKSLREFEPTMLGEINTFMQQLMKEARRMQPVDLSERSKQLGMDIVGLLAFGYPLKMQTEPAHRFMIRGLKVGTFQNNSFMQWPLLKSLGIHHLLTIVGRAQRMKYLQVLRHMIGNRLSEAKHARCDLYSFTADHLDDPANGIDASELWNEALFFFPAAGDTTSTAISALFFYLSRNPDVYQKLAEEIRITFSQSDEIRNGPKLASCRYLRACIDEALRMSPPVAGTLWREPHADEQAGQPFVVAGHVIPPGTQVGVSIYGIHHNEKYFDEPFVFRPQRWLDEDTETLRRMHSAFCPFSIGARGCAGKSMAYLETSLIIATTLWYFDFQVAPGESGKAGAGVEGRMDGRGRPEEFQLWDSFGSEHIGPNLIFQPREEALKELKG
ncbi:cytochrome P450 [Thozetella sp. PMI_491]|nr:cytochrome P450 [Thozetella sp. PMI_491]